MAVTSKIPVRHTTFIFFSGYVCSESSLTDREINYSQLCRQVTGDGASRRLEV